jgi:hypothetical protein
MTESTESISAFVVIATTMLCSRSILGTADAGSHGSTGSQATMDKLKMQNLSSTRFINVLITYLAVTGE